MENNIFFPGSKSDQPTDVVHDYYLDIEFKIFLLMQPKGHIWSFKPGYTAAGCLDTLGSDLVLKSVSSFLRQ